MELRESDECVARGAYDGGEDGPRSIVPSEASLAHPRPIIHHQRRCLVVAHPCSLDLISEMCVTFETKAEGKLAAKTLKRLCVSRCKGVRAICKLPC